MDALTLLEQRVSSPQLGDIAPSEAQLQRMFAAALRAPDHGALRPWRFLTVGGDDRLRLGELFLQAALAQEPQLSDARQQRMLQMPLRAPLLVVVIGCPKPHPKIPEIEQLLSAGVAAQNMLLSAFAQGIGGIWRTGEMAYDAQVKQGLGLTDSEQLVGFLYLGSQPERLKPVPVLDSSDFVQAWSREA